MENKNRELEDIFAPHEPDLVGFSDTVKASTTHGQKTREFEITQAHS